MPEYAQQVKVVVIVSLVVVSIVTGAGLISTAAVDDQSISERTIASHSNMTTQQYTTPSISNQLDIGSHTDSTTQQFSFAFELPPESLTYTVKTSDILGEYGANLEEVSVSGSNKLSAAVNSNGDVDLTIDSGSGMEEATISFTMNTEKVQIPDTSFNYNNHIEPPENIPTFSMLVSQRTTQASGFEIQETGIQDTDATTIQSDDTEIENGSTLNQSINLDLVVPDDGDADGDTYNVTIDTDEALGQGINISDAFIEDDPTGPEELINCSAPVVNENETVSLTIREAAANHSDGAISREVITLVLKLDATQHDAGAFTPDDSITHVIDDEAGNTTANVFFESKLAQEGAAFDVSFGVENDTVEVGDSVSLMATVNNTGNVENSVLVQFKADGGVFKETNVTVGAGNETTVSASASFTTPGNHTVTVNDQPATEITVIQSGPPPVIGDSTPVDPNNDDAFEDLTGDGEVDSRDVLALWNNKNELSPQYFDFTGDGSVDARDVLELWNQL